MFAGTLMVALRESLEALLVCGILLGIVTKLGHREARRPIIVGGLLGALASVVIGVGVYLAVGKVPKANQAWFEAIAGLVAVAVLTYMVVWMYKHTMKTVGALHEKAKLAVLSGRSSLLFWLAFVMVVREGIETVLFIAPRMTTANPWLIVSALAAGLAIAFVLAWALFTGTIRLSLEQFFTVTGVLLIFFGGGMIVYSLHELHEAWHAATTGVLWNAPISQGSIPGRLLQAVFGYREKPRLLEVVGYVLYVGTMLAWYLRPYIQRRRAAKLEQKVAGSTP